MKDMCKDMPDKSELQVATDVQCWERRLYDVMKAFSDLDVVPLADGRIACATCASGGLAANAPSSEGCQ